LGGFDCTFVVLRVRPETFSWIAELSQHEADGCEFQEGEAAAVEIFPVFGEPAAFWPFRRYGAPRCQNFFFPVADYAAECSLKPSGMTPSFA
jgi:hypothetical protein